MAYKCYQCPEEGEETVDEVVARRKAEIRAHFAADQAAADVHLYDETVEPVAVVDVTIPEENPFEDEPEEVEVKAAPKAKAKKATTEE